ncbi:MAG: hypothetical protein SGPRY_002373 [Prymnesium sp.]
MGAARGSSPRRHRAAACSSDEEESPSRDRTKLEARTDAGKHITAMLSSLLLKDTKSAQATAACGLLDVHNRLVLCYRRGGSVLQIIEPSMEIPSRIVIAAEKLANGLNELEWGSESGQKDKKVSVRVQMQPAQLSMTVSSEDLGCEMASHSRCAIIKAHAYVICRNNWRQAESACIQLDANGLFDLKVKFANSQVAIVPANEKFSLEKRRGLQTPGLVERFVQFFVHPLLDDEEELGVTQGGVQTAKEAG